MTKIGFLEALRYVTLYLKEYTDALGDTKLDAGDLDPEEISSQLSTLSARISAIVAAVGDDSSSSSEIVDARVSNGAIAYDSLGDHIRAIESGDALDAGAVSSTALADSVVTPAKLSSEFMEEYYSAADVDKRIEDVVPNGLINPTEKTSSMIEEVGIDTDTGRLYTSRDSSLSARLDALILAAGDETSSSAEIVDARISNGATAYDSLGAHIRAIESGDALDAGAVTAEKLGDDVTENYKKVLERLDAIEKGQIAVSYNGNEESLAVTVGT